MKQSTKKKMIAFALATAICGTLGLSACGGGGSVNDENTLILDFGSLMPTNNTTPTATNPEVIQSTKFLANEFAEENGWKIMWAKELGRSANQQIDEMSNWYNRQTEAGNCPVIGFTSLNMFQDRTTEGLNWYVPLDEYLEKPNPYVEAGQKGSVHWKDMFYDYVWESSSVKNLRGEIIAIPLLLSAGSQTGIYYNTEIFEDIDAEVPTDWDSYVNLIKNMQGYTPFKAYTGYTSPGLYQWAMEFSLTPNVLKFMTEHPDDNEWGIDYNSDGSLMELEVLRGVLDGKFDPREEGPAQAVYYKAYEFYTEIPADSFTSTSYTEKWDSGKLAMWDNGLWNIPMENSNTARKFNYDIFLTPLADDSSTGLEDYAVETEYVSFDEAQCPVSVALNVMAHGVKNNPKKLEAAIDLLMFITAKDNLSMIAEEKGGTKGAVVGSSYNKLIDGTVKNPLTWKDQDFPVVSYSAKWPTGYTTAQSNVINKSFESWVGGNKKMDDEKFFETLYNAQMAGARDFMKSFNLTEAELISLTEE